MGGDLLALHRVEQAKKVEASNKLEVVLHYKHKSRIHLHDCSSEVVCREKEARRFAHDQGLEYRVGHAELGDAPFELRIRFLSTSRQEVMGTIKLKQLLARW